MRKHIVAVISLMMGLVAQSSGNWTYTIENNEVTITGYEFGTELVDLAVPSEIEGNPVTRIGDYAFGASDLLTGITIPATVISIGEQAFRQCHGLQSVSVHGPVTEFPERVFMDCDYLTDVFLAEGVKSIGYGAFLNCERLKNINIPESATTIYDSVFKGCIRLPSIIIGKNVTYIDLWAFNGCQSLVSIYFNGDAPVVEADAFLDVPLDCTIYYYADTSGWGTYLAGVQTQAIPRPDPVKWGKYTIPDTVGAKWIDTGDWLGWVEVTHRPWIWRDETGQYIYVPDASAMAGRGWNYAP